MSDDVARIFDERAEQADVRVADSLRASLLSYYRLLTHWNRKINLTSLLDPAQAIDRLLLEPVSSAEHFPAGVRLADLGSGGGSPALPLALALGSPELLMIESRTRKAAFLREAARELGVTAVVEAVRFEALLGRDEYASWAGLVTMRAVRPDRVSMNLARTLASPGGTIAIFSSESAQIPDDPTLENRSTWNTRPSGMLITFHVKHQ
jgi:16S rRNA (guanine527-N7)-methyltransferase